MDPLTHAALGASLAHVTLRTRLPRHAWMAGALGGLLPDADILIRSSADPLLAIEYHRHFTHALAFIPIGGVVATLPWLMRKTMRAHWLWLYLASCLGYATHGLLDACTNYGTHLLWPFLDWRTSWNWITTVGPLLTLALLIGLVFAVRGNARRPALIALLFCLAYLGIAVVQHDRALAAQTRLAAARGHVIERAAAFPTVGNPFIWRSLYQANGEYHSDRLRVMTDIRWQAGGRIAVLTPVHLEASAIADPDALRDYQRFSFFSADWVARATDDPSVIGDVRYSLRSDRFEPIWGIRLHPGTRPPVEWVDRTTRNRIPALELWREITGEAEGYRPLPMPTALAKAAS